MKLVIWILKRFWFPILLFVIGQLGKQNEKAAKLHKTLKKLR